MSDSCKITRTKESQDKLISSFVIECESDTKENTVFTAKVNGLEIASNRYKGDIEWFGIQGEKRRSGLGIKAYNTLENWLKENKNYVYLSLQPANSLAEKFWTKAGYTCTRQGDTSCDQMRKDWD